MPISYTVDFTKSNELQKKMELVPDKAEKTVNDVLKTKGTKQMIAAIVGLIPVSKRNKQHAKMSRPLSSKMMNLGFRVFTRGGPANSKNSFGYLIFPDEGRGPHNNIAHQFFTKGGKASSAVIFNDVVIALEKAAQIK